MRRNTKNNILRKMKVLKKINKKKKTQMINTMKNNRNLIMILKIDQLGESMINTK